MSDQTRVTATFVIPQPVTIIMFSQKILTMQMFFLISSACACFSQELHQIQDCPICKDDKGPDTFFMFLSKSATKCMDYGKLIGNESSETDQNCKSSCQLHESKKDSDTLYVEFSEDEDREIRLIKESNKQVSISFFHFSGDVRLMMQKLKNIDTSRFASIDFRYLKAPLSIEDVRWITTLKNLNRIAFNTKTIKPENLRDLSRLQNLKYVVCKSDSTEKTTQLVCQILAECHSVEYLSLSQMNFGGGIALTLPAKVNTLKIYDSFLTASAIASIGGSSSVRHVEIQLCDMPEPIEKCTFNPGLRCLATGNKSISDFFVNNIDEFPSLRFVGLDIPEKQFHELRRNLRATPNELLFLILLSRPHDDAVTDSFVEVMRNEFAIHVDTDVAWTNLMILYRAILVHCVVVQEF